jgi:phosphoglycerate kinase
MSLEPVARALGEVLGKPVAFANDCVGPSAEQAAAALRDGDILVLENTRFHSEEEKNDPGFAAQLAKLADLYVNDAFSAAHRAHASTEAVARLLPAYAGRLMQAELEALAAALNHPERPVAAIVGGSKVSTKLDLLGNLIAKVDMLAIGGAMANTFLSAQGIAVGRSLEEPGLHSIAREILKKAASQGCAVMLPEDAVVATALEAGIPTATVPISAVPAETMILDVGPASVASLVTLLRAARTLVWNGPVGAFETPPFDAATNTIANKVAEATQAGRLRSIAGGGDTVSALRHASVVGRLSYVSTAGGAFLEWLEGKVLPGVAALDG